MTWDTMLSEMNDSVKDLYGVAATHTTQDAVTVTAIAALVIERLGADGDATCDIDSVDVATPGIGDLITIGIETWRLFDRSALGSGYWPCELRQLSEWGQVAVYTYDRTANDWKSTPEVTLWMHIMTSDNGEEFETDVGRTRSLDYEIVAPYNANLNSKVKLVFDGRDLYPTSVIPDDSRSYRMMIQAGESDS